jgi:hypothetical protein
MIFSGGLVNVNIHHNWKVSFSFHFPEFDESDSFEPSQVVMGYLMPAAAQCHSLSFPWDNLHC